MDWQSRAVQHVLIAWVLRSVDTQNGCEFPEAFANHNEAIVMAMAMVCEKIVSPTPR